MKTGLIVALFTCFGCVVFPEQVGASAWTTNSPMLVPRCDHTATRLLNGTVLVCGGETNWTGPITAPTASAELYIPSSNKWVLTGTMDRARSKHTTTLLPDGRVLVCGGAGDVANPTTLLSNAEIYLPEQNGQGGFWTSVGSMSEARRDHSATLLLNGKVLVVGGQGSGPYPGILASAELFDPAKGAWTITGSMNQARSGHTATLLPNGQVLVTGGFIGNNITVSSAEMFDPESGTWSPVASMNTDRATHWATMLLDGRALIVGGWQYSPIGGNYLRSTEIYDPASGNWQTNGIRTGNALGSGLCLMPTGDVLAAAGYGTFGVNYPTNSEVYLAGTDIWTNTSACLSPRQDGTMTMLADGRILFTGGRWGLDVHESSELFTSSAAVTPPTLAIAALPTSGIQITFTNRPGALFQVLSSSNPSRPTNEWSVRGGAIEIFPGQFEIKEPYLLDSRRFYRLISIP